MDRGRRLEDRVVVVTGGAQGIGLGIGTRLAEEGAIVILARLTGETVSQAEADAALSARTVSASSVSTPASGTATALSCGRIR